MIEIVYAAFIILLYGLSEVVRPDGRVVLLVTALLLAGCGVAGAIGVTAALAAFVWLEVRHG